jgi:hypothetical protein
VTEADPAAPPPQDRKRTVPQTITTKDGTFELHSEARALHWVAWLARTGDPRPERSVLLVGQTQEEAESNARLWAEKSLG